MQGTSVSYLQVQLCFHILCSGLQTSVIYAFLIGFVWQRFLWKAYYLVYIIYDVLFNIFNQWYFLNVKWPRNRSNKTWQPVLCVVWTGFGLHSINFEMKLLSWKTGSVLIFNGQSHCRKEKCCPKHAESDVNLGFKTQGFYISTTHITSTLIRVSDSCL